MSQESAQVVGLENLPDEILLRIFSMSKAEELLELRLVNKRFNSIVSDFSITKKFFKPQMTQNELKLLKLIYKMNDSQLQVLGQYSDKGLVVKNL